MKVYGISMVLFWKTVRPVAQGTRESVLCYHEDNSV